MLFNDPDTRGSAGRLFEKMFLEKFRNDPSTVPPCFEMLAKSGMRPDSPLNQSTPMPWDGLDGPPKIECISKGKDADKISYWEKELKAVIVAAMDNDPPPIRFLTPEAKNWATWDAALIRYAEENGTRVVHMCFFQTTTDPQHDILAKGLSQVRDAIPAEYKSVLKVYYHYILVLLER